MSIFCLRKSVRRTSNHGKKLTEYDDEEDERPFVHIFSHGVKIHNNFFHYFVSRNLVFAHYSLKNNLRTSIFHAIISSHLLSARKLDVRVSE